MVPCRVLLLLSFAAKLSYAAPVVEPSLQTSKMSPVKGSFAGAA